MSDPDDQSLLVGRSIPRVEDERFLSGKGRYTDDHAPDAVAWGVVVRSIEANARIVSIDVHAARAMPGVLAVLTASDAETEGLGTIDPLNSRPMANGDPMRVPARRVLNRDFVRYVGDPVAFVVADSLEAAKDAAEAVEVDYETMPAVVALEPILDGSAPAVRSEWPDNLAFRFERGDVAAAADGLAAAAHVTRLDLKLSRVQPTPLEPRVALGQFDPETERFTLYAPTQAPWRLKSTLAEQVFGINPDRMRVVSPDMGGGFGNRSVTLPEYALVLWAAKLTGRPVKWRADRSETFQSDDQARHSLARVELGLDRDGRFLSMRVRILYGLGAYHSQMSIGPATNNIGVLAGAYRIPSIHVTVDGAFLNANPAGAYRGAGRPEACYMLERTIDTAAREMGIDPAELRRLNMISPRDLPYKTALTFTYDSGDFPGLLNHALILAERDTFEERRAASKARGRLRGIGIAFSIESAGSPARPEHAKLMLREDGRVVLTIGTHNHGQGHETVFRQILSDALGLATDGIDYVQGDTDTLPDGGGTASSRSAAVGGGVAHAAALKLIAAARTIAAEALEAAEADVEFRAGRFAIVGSDHQIGWTDVAKYAASHDLLDRLDIADSYAVEAVSFPNTCAVAEVDVDPQTGQVTLERYTVAGDFGTVLNPMLLEGQIHGGVAQGAGQILMEEMRWDDRSGQLLTGSFMDYAMPRAGDVPRYDVLTASTPTESNMLQVKGAGEAGCVSSLAAVMNGIVDALAPLGVRSIDMPASPQRVWQAIQNAGR